MIVILIIGSAVITRAHVSLSIQNKNVSEKQAYLNAKSTAKILTKELSKAITAVEYTPESLQADIDERVISSTVPFGLTQTPALSISSLDELVAKMIMYRSKHPEKGVSFTLTVKEVNSDIKCTFSDETGFEYDFAAEITGKNQSEKYVMIADYVLNREPNIQSQNEGDLYTYSFNEYRSKASLEE
jgi:hypothetical protein